MMPNGFDDLVSNLGVMSYCYELHLKRDGCSPDDYDPDCEDCPFGREEVAPPPPAPADESDTPASNSKGGKEQPDDR